MKRMAQEEVKSGNEQTGRGWGLKRGMTCTQSFREGKGWATGNGPSSGSQGSQLLQTFKAGEETNSFQEGKEII